MIGSSRHLLDHFSILAWFSKQTLTVKQQMTLIVPDSITGSLMFHKTKLTVE